MAASLHDQSRYSLTSPKSGCDRASDGRGNRRKWAESSPVGSSHYPALVRCSDDCSENPCCSLTIECSKLQNGTNTENQCRDLERLAGCVIVDEPCLCTIDL